MENVSVGWFAERVPCKLWISNEGLHGIGPPGGSDRDRMGIPKPSRRFVTAASPLQSVYSAARSAEQLPFLMS